MPSDECERVHSTCASLHVRGLCLAGARLSVRWPPLSLSPALLTGLPLQARHSAVCSTRGSISTWSGSSTRTRPGTHCFLTESRGAPGQPLPPIRFGETAWDVRRFRIGAVMIKQHLPPETWILFTRTRPQVWKLIDDAQGRLKLVRVAFP